MLICLTSFSLPFAKQCKGREVALESATYAIPKEPLKDLYYAAPKEPLKDLYDAAPIKDLCDAAPKEPLKEQVNNQTKYRSKPKPRKENCLKSS